MFTQFKVALAALLVASAPLHLRADSIRAAAEPLRAGEVRQAEAGVSTSADHLRLATWYQAQVRLTETQLAEEEKLVKYWAATPGMALRTKTPNTYFSAQALARYYREKLENLSKLAVSHMRLAEDVRTAAGQ